MDRLTKHWGNNCVPTKLDLECMFDMSDEQAEQLQEIIKKLADYEDAEEQGLLAKVVYGEWIDHGTLNDYPEKGMNNYHLLVCSECGCCHRTTLQDNIGKPFNANFCPNCGAKMQKLAELKGV